MKVEQLAVVHGWKDTRGALRRWNRAPGRVLGEWALGSLAVTLLLLAATWYVAALSVPDPTHYAYPGLTRQARFSDFGFLLYRNGLVLALHAAACMAGFIAGYSNAHGNRLHVRAGRYAMAFVGLATLFSLGTQAFALGSSASTLAARLGVSPLHLLIALAPHAVPELFALFLPLAAWTIAARRGAWNELLAATFLTTALAIPLLVIAASVETWVTPRLLMGLTG
jgi:uncharacterized membrane protein SpoIIM required for sporulation